MGDVTLRRASPAASAPLSYDSPRAFFFLAPRQAPSRSPEPLVIPRRIFPCVPRYCFKPQHLMLMAAFKSRSISKPHSEHTKTRSERRRLSFFQPHPLQHLLLGANLSISTNTFPNQSALYRSCRLYSYQPQSATAFAKV